MPRACFPFGGANPAGSTNPTHGNHFLISQAPHQMIAALLHSVDFCLIQSVYNSLVLFSVKTATCTNHEGDSKPDLILWFISPAPQVNHGCSQCCYQLCFCSFASPSLPSPWPKSSFKSRQVNWPGNTFWGFLGFWAFSGVVLQGLCLWCPKAGV